MKPRAWNSTLPARTERMKRGKGLTARPGLGPGAWDPRAVMPQRPAASGKPREAPKNTGPHSFPPAAAVLIDWRDSDHDGALPVRLCQNCGTTRDPQRHHRRGKDSGGSEGRAHTHCPCDGVTLCGPGGNGCHQQAHAHPREAQAKGLIVSQSVDRPATEGVMRFAAAEGGATQWPTCDGRWLDEAPGPLGEDGSLSFDGPGRAA